MARKPFFDLLRTTSFIVLGFAFIDYLYHINVEHQTATLEYFAAKVAYGFVVLFFSIYFLDFTNMSSTQKLLLLTAVVVAMDLIIDNSKFQFHDINITQLAVHYLTLGGLIYFSQQKEWL